jgi:hypothetical protein
MSQKNSNDPYPYICDQELLDKKGKIFSNYKQINLTGILQRKAEVDLIGKDKNGSANG